MSKLDITRPSFYRDIEENIEMHRLAFVKSNIVDDEEFLRSTSEAKCILNLIEESQNELFDFFNEHSYLLTLFEKEYGPFKEYIDRETVLELCFLDDFLFPEKELMPFMVDEEFNEELIQSHKENFREWMNDVLKRHQETEVFLDTKFDEKLKPSQLDCQCTMCISVYRTKLRDSIYYRCREKIENLYEQFKDSRFSGDIDDYANQVFQLKREVDRILHSVRYRLKRASLNKLDQQIKALLKETFDYKSSMTQRFIDVIKDLYITDLRQRGLKKDLIDEDAYQRYFAQLGLNVWRNEKFHMREFSKLVKSILALKRKDISAQILRDYLGQFWIHSEARKMPRKFIYHMGPTNSGKTYHAIQALAEAKTGCYLAPLRLLAGELYDTLNEKDVNTTLLTGEEVIEQEGATHTSSTIEMVNLNDRFDCCVVDEIQMINDPQRGWAWTRALVSVQSPEIHVCGDGSVYELVKRIAELCGDTLEVKNYNRMTELKVLDDHVKLGDLEKGDAVIVFSRRNALKYKRDLENLGFKVSIVYGRLSPEVRREQARKFDEGETDIIVSTDAIAMGMNLPIRRVIFTTLSKFINSKEYPISHSEIKQIAGRAGRYQRFPTGYVSCLERVEDGIGRIHEALNADLAQKEHAMVGPDLDIFNRVNSALGGNKLPELKLSEFLRLFNTMTFKSPFYCVNLSEMIEVTEMVEQADMEKDVLTSSEMFGFSCAPVNLGLVDHVQYFVWILNNYVNGVNMPSEDIDANSDSIDYLETSIKCVELYQWLARHFDNKNFDFDQTELLANKSLAVEKLNDLLSEKIVLSCPSCGVKLDPNSKFNICEACFKSGKFRPRRNKGGANKPRRRRSGEGSGRKDAQGGQGGGKKHAGGKKKSFNKGKGGSGKKKKGPSKGKKAGSAYSKYRK